MLRHFEFSFPLGHICLSKFIYRFNAHFKSLIKKLSMSLRCPHYYLLLFIKKIVVNITDFPTQFKLYKKNFLIDSHVKVSDRNY